MEKTQQYMTKLKQFYRRNRRMPSYRELADFCGFASVNAAQYHVRRWITDGIVEKDRAGKLLPGPAFNALRMLGTVQAGFPSPAEEENVDTISLDDWLVEKKEASFMLTVTGDSMIDAGINPGDMVIIERGRKPRHGDVVIAEVDHEWTMKFYEIRGKKFILQPANKNYPPIIPEDELNVAGVVRAVIRKY
jgi:SOS regulatory protein LexA